MASDVVRGLGMLPSGDPAEPTEITFNLTTMRRKDMRFTRFYARPGIVRKLYHSVEEGGCGACTDENPMCGARFEVFRDGVAVYSAVVPSRGEVEIDVRNASTLTLLTATVEPTLEVRRGVKLRRRIAPGARHGSGQGELLRRSGVGGRGAGVKTRTK